MNKNNNNKNKKIKGSKIKSKTNNLCICNSLRVYGNGHQPKQAINTPAMKCVDTFYSNINVMASGAVLPGVVGISQGVGVSNRVGNRIYIDRAFFNFNIAQINTDIVSQSRVILFQWFPDSSVGTPTVPFILETLNDCQSMYNWEKSSQYRIVHDVVYFQSGITAVPTTSSNVGYYGEIDISSCFKTLEFTTASPLGANQLYILVISDSLVAPFPQFEATFRLLYRD